MEQAITILKPEGILDRAGAEAVLHEAWEVASGGAKRLEMDFSGVERAHFEALQRLKAGIDELLARYKKLRFQIVGTGELIAVQLQLLSWAPAAKAVPEVAAQPVSEPLTAPRPKPTADFPSGAEVHCASCRHEIRVPRSGHFACPHCGVHFFRDSKGRTSFYESLFSRK